MFGEILAATDSINTVYLVGVLSDLSYFFL